MNTHSRHYSNSPRSTVGENPLMRPLHHHASQFLFTYPVETFTHHYEKHSRLDPLLPSRSVENVDLRITNAYLYSIHDTGGWL